MTAEPEVVVDSASPLWAEALPDAADLCRRVALITLAAGGPPRAGGATLELSLVLSDDAAVRALNRAYRARDQATNVLSFAALDQDGPLPPGAPLLLGDVIIAFETTRREAGQEDKLLAHHLAHLVAHGVLHLLGYDHETQHEAERMERLERQVLAALGIPDPYREPPQ